jgi:hypothetical protein
MSDETDKSDMNYDVSDLPQPATLTPRQMLEEREDVNILAPLVRCSKRESGQVTPLISAMRLMTRLQYRLDTSHLCTRPT